MLLNPKQHQESMFSSYFPITREHKILGLYWAPAIVQTMKLNKKYLICKIVHELICHQYNFNTIIDNVQCVNVSILSKCIFHSQIFPFVQSFWTSLNKFVGFFLWKWMLRINREELILPYNCGGINLKDAQTHERALILHRTLNVICEYYDFLFWAVSKYFM